MLMRVYNPVLGKMDEIDYALNQNYPRRLQDTPGPLEQIFLYRFQRAIRSVHINRAALIICDDTPHTDNDDEDIRWKAHDERLKSILKDYGFVQDDNLFIVQTNKGGEGSAMASWILKLKFLEITENNDKAFAILLDQDDELYEDAVDTVRKRMRNNTVIISAFDLAGDIRLDISNKAGRKKSKRSKKQSRRHLICYYFKWLLKCGKNLAYLIYFWRVWRCFVPRMSTIGWTKAYSRTVMDYMVKDFKCSFCLHNENIDDYFKSHQAYEDFLDFYTLLNKKVKIIYNLHATHKYYKHPGSITAKPDLYAFEKLRPTMLSKLSIICNDNKDKLCYGWKILLRNFLYRKIDEIEKILARYRKEDELSGNSSKIVFPGDFAEILLKKNSQDKNLYVAVDFWKKSCLKKVERERCSIRSFADDSWLAWQPSPKEDLLKKTTKSTRVSIIFLISISFIFFILPALLNFNGKNINYQDRINSENVLEIIGIITTICATILTIMYEINARISEKADESIKLKKLYFSEFEDFIRHVEANLRVGFQTLRELKEHKTESAYCPSYIHFENFKWPESSTLFNEEIAILIDKSRIDDFNRLRLNIRNMNNSAQWLEEYCKSKEYCTKDMIDMLEWELTRVLAYLCNFMYLKDHEFNFNTGIELNEYIASPKIKKKLRLLFSKEYPNDDKDKIIRHFLERYFCDRKEQSSVLIHLISSPAELVAGDGSGDGHVEGFGGSVGVGGE